MDSIQLNNIVDRAVRELAAIGVTGIYDLLSIDDIEPTDGFEVMHTILEETIDRFEYYEPFGIKLNMYFVSNSDYTFEDNFDAFLAGSVNRSQLQLVPRVITSVINVYNGTTRGLVYEPPVLYNAGYSGKFMINCICNRPLRWHRDGNRYTEDSRYYFLGETYKPALLRFRNLFLLNLSKYIVRLNENTKYPNMPLELMDGLNNFVNSLQGRVEEDFNLSHGYYPVYH